MLDDVAEIMLKNTDVTFSISGYTDNVGPDEYNLRLSSRRANEARNYLIERGVETDRITAKGYGEVNPKYGNDTEQSRQLNRRVEIKSVGHYENKTQVIKKEDE
jgi:OOP family OmpA-OmpF porin